MDIEEIKALIEKVAKTKGTISKANAKLIMDSFKSIKEFDIANGNYIDFLNGLMCVLYSNDPDDKIYSELLDMDIDITEEETIDLPEKKMILDLIRSGASKSEISYSVKLALTKDVAKRFKQKVGQEEYPLDVILVHGRIDDIVDRFKKDLKLRYERPDNDQQIHKLYRIMKDEINHFVNGHKHIDDVLTIVSSYELNINPDKINSDLKNTISGLLNGIVIPFIDNDNMNNYTRYHIVMSVYISLMIDPKSKNRSKASAKFDTFRDKAIAMFLTSKISKAEEEKQNTTLMNKKFYELLAIIRKGLGLIRDVEYDDLLRKFVDKESLLETLCGKVNAHKYNVGCPSDLHEICNAFAYDIEMVNYINDSLYEMSKIDIESTFENSFKTALIITVAKEFEDTVSLKEICDTMVEWLHN